MARGLLVTQWEMPGGTGSSSGGWPTISFSTLMLLVESFNLQNCLLDNLDTMLVEALNPALSYPIWYHVVTNIIKMARLLEKKKVDRIASMNDAYTYVCV